MLENIKLILNLNDDKYDQLILLYKSKVSNVVMSYCNIDNLNPALESFIEDKVTSIMKSKIVGGTQNTGGIKSVSRGDTKIEYNVGDTSIGVNLADEDRKFLNQFRKLRFF